MAKISRRQLIRGTILGGFAGVFLPKTTQAASPITVTVSSVQSSRVVLSLSSAQAVKVYVEYGVKFGNFTSKTQITTLNKNSNITVTGLKAATKYFYRIRYVIGNSTKYLVASSGNFTTSTQTANSVFAVQADPHMDENSDTNVYLGTLGQIVAASPAFLIDLGDIFMVDKLKDKSESNIRARFELMKGFYEKLQGVPLKICLGNHDGELGYSKFNTKSYRKEYFPDQTGELAYFAIDGPDQLHVVLDPFTYTTENPKSDGWQWTLGNTQYKWLEDTLKNSKAKFKFVYIHHLLVGDATSRGGVEIAQFNEWGGKNRDGSDGFSEHRAGWSKPIHQLLRDYGVSIVFKGHDHLYVKQELDGIIYQTVPQPSHPGFKVDPSQYGYLSGTALGGSGFLKVSTDSGQIKVEFIQYDGKIADTYVRQV